MYFVQLLINLSNKFNSIQHQDKFLVCANTLGNKALSDSDSDSDSEPGIFIEELDELLSSFSGDCSPLVVFGDLHCRLPLTHTSNCITV